MANHEIDEEHRAYFFEYLKVLDRITALDLEDIDHMLRKSGWPKRGQSVVFTASAPSALRQYLPYQLCCCIISAPNHLSRRTPILEVALMDTLVVKGVTRFPLSVSVFPEGRTVLKVSGLVLDSDEGGISAYERKSLLEDRAQFFGNETVLAFVRQAIEIFPTSHEELKFTALADLVMTGTSTSGSSGH